MESEFDGSFRAGAKLGERNFLLLERDAGWIVSNGSKAIPTKGIRGKVVAGLHPDAKGIQAVFDRQRSDGAGFFAEGVKGRFSEAKNVYDTVNVLLNSAHAAETGL